MPQEITLQKKWLEKLVKEARFVKEANHELMPTIPGLSYLLGYIESAAELIEGKNGN